MQIQYRIHFVEHPDHCVLFDLEFDEKMSLKPRLEVLPDWTYLDRHQCSHCPLVTKRHCPAAAAIAPLLKPFVGHLSHEQVYLEVAMPNRKIKCEGSLQQVLGALVGLAFAGSGCPHLNFFRPMAYLHLPLASPEETFLRVASLHLLGLWNQSRQGDDVVWGLDDLFVRYQAVQEVNRKMMARLQEASHSGDASTNAVALLDVFAQYGGEIGLAESQMDQLKGLFESYTKS
jgi:hypothetical protein